MTYLARWHIERFGHFVQTAHMGLGPGLNLLLGPNEAGKSTLLAFLTWVLFGPKGMQQREVGLANDGAGTVWFVDGDRTWSIARRGRSVDVLFGGTESLPIAAILGSVDRGLFRTVLAFDLADLAGLGSLTDDALRQRLFAAGLTGGGRSVREVRVELGQEMKALRRPRAQSRITDLLGKIRETHERLKAATEAARRLPQRTRDLGDLRRQHAELGERSSALAFAATRLDALLKAHPHAVARRHALERLDAMALQPRIDEAAWRQIDEASAEVVSLEERLVEARDAVAAIAEDLDRLPGRDIVNDHEPVVVQLHERLAEVEGDLRAIELTEAEERRVRESLAQALGELGIAEASALDAMRIPAVRRNQLVNEARRLSEHHAQLAQGEEVLFRRRDQLEQEAATLRLQLEGLARNPVAASRVEDARDLLRRWRTEIAERLRELSSRTGDAATALQEARKLLRLVGVGSVSDLPDLSLDEERPFLEQARAQWMEVEDATRAAATAADSARRARIAWETARDAVGELPPKGAHLAVAADLRRLHARVEMALGARSRAIAAAERAQELLREQRHHEEALGQSIDRLPGSPLPQRDLQALTMLCAAAREAAASERNAHDSLAQVPRPTDPAPKSEELARLRERLSDLAALRGLFDDASRPNVTGQVHRTQRKKGIAVALGLCGALLVLIATFVQQHPLVALLGLLALVAAVVVALAPPWFGAKAIDTGDSAARQRLKAALASLSLPFSAGTAEAREAEERTRQELQARESAAQAHAALLAVSSRLSAAHERSKTSCEDLAKWLGDHGLPVDLDADHAERWAATLADALRARENAEAAAGASSRDQAVWDAFVADSRRVLATIGVSAAADALPEALATASAALAEEERQARARAEQEAREEALRRELAVAEEQVRQAELRVNRARQAAAEMTEKARARGFPDRLSLEDIGPWLQEVREARRAWASAEGLARVAREASHAIDVWREQGRALAAAVCLPWTTDDIRPLVEHCEHAAEIEQQSRNLTERISAIEAQRDALDREAATAKRLRDAWHQDNDAWRARSTECGLPDIVEPRNVAAFLGVLSVALDARDRLTAAETRRRAEIARREAFLVEVREVCAKTDEPSPADVRAAILRVHALARRNAIAREVELQRSNHRDASARQDGEVKRLEGRLQQTVARRSGLLVKAGVHDAAAARDAFENHAGCAEMESEALRRRQAVEEHLGSHPGAEAELRDGDPIAWQALRDARISERDALDGQRQEIAKRLGVEENAQESLLERADVAQHDTELKGLEHELHLAVREYAILHLADHLLDQALDRYRREKQPQVLRRASELWSIVTDRAWSNIRPTIDGDELEVIDDHGHVTSVGALSRGTAEQLYFCLRLSLAEALSEGGQVRLPLVLDDVLVNFDEERAVAASRVLVEVARNRQVLMFSCSQQTHETLRAAGAEPNVVPLPRFAGGSSPVVLKVEAPVLPPRVATQRGDAHRTGDVEQRIIEHLKSAVIPLGRADIAGPLELDDAVWHRAIRGLVQDGVVSQSGAKRGTKYMLASRSFVADNADE